jgi:hypothetical protein
LNPIHPANRPRTRSIIRIRIDSPISKEIRWAWALFARDTGLPWTLVEDKTAPIDLLISEDPGADLVLSMAFRASYQSNQFHFKRLMGEEPVILNEAGHPDYLSTTFYLVNSIQEHHPGKKDQFNRFPYSESLQANYGCIEENLVGGYFKALYQSIPLLRESGPLLSHPSRLFLSHDIDFLYGSWKEDGKAVLLKGRIDQFVSLLARKGSKNEDWFNTGELMGVDKKHGFPATFFWIPEQTKNRTQNPPDADYTLSDPRVLTALDEIHNAPAFEIGLHRSSLGSLLTEVNKLPFPVRANRNHFLKINLPDHYEAVAASGLKIDASLGFAEHFGFRNSYGKPFSPWSAKQHKTLPFIEVPLHFMDATFEHYLKTGPDGAIDACASFMEKHQNDCVLSLLWHNNYFSKHAYGDYREVYLEMLPLIRSFGIQGIDNEDLIRHFSA